MKEFIVTRFPFLVPVLKPVYNKWLKARYQSMSTEAIFTEIYKKKRWTNVGSISRSGPHSELATTETIRIELPNLFKNLGITSLLDIPCGDFNWLKDVDLDFLSYTGADIVSDIIHQNNERYAKKNREFIQMDILADELPTVDLILCRDLLVHIPLHDIFKAINNIKKSHSTYLLASSHIPRPSVKANYDIITGQWRPINLLLSPFSFPKPLTTIDEKISTEKLQNKRLLLWKITDLPKVEF